jgi:GMP synthase-like glutamine amidotransferase
MGTIMTPIIQTARHVKIKGVAPMAFGRPMLLETAVNVNVDLLGNCIILFMVHWGSVDARYQDATVLYQTEHLPIEALYH